MQNLPYNETKTVSTPYLGTIDSEHVEGTLGLQLFSQTLLSDLI